MYTATSFSYYSSVTAERNITVGTLHSLSYFVHSMIADMQVYAF